MNAARLLLAAALLLPGCSRPEPPEIKPISGKVTTISPTGIDVQATLEGHNPNDFDLKVESATATIVLDGNVNLGKVTESHAISLPAHKRVKFNMPVAVRWSSVAPLVPLALSNRDVPYEVEGKVRLSKPVDVEVPFKLSGTLTHAQLQQAAGSAIPKVPLPF